MSPQRDRSPYLFAAEDVHLACRILMFLDWYKSVRGKPRRRQGRSPQGYMIARVQEVLLRELPNLFHFIREGEWNSHYVSDLCPSMIRTFHAVALGQVRDGGGTVDMGSFLEFDGGWDRRDNLRSLSIEDRRAHLRALLEAIRDRKIIDLTLR